MPGPWGYDAGKKTGGRQRFGVTDTVGLLLVVLVCLAGVADRDGARTSLLTCYGASTRPQLEELLASAELGSVLRQGQAAVPREWAPAG